MKVHELITLLKKQPSNLNVRVSAPDRSPYAYKESETMWQVRSVVQDCVAVGDENVDYCVVLEVTNPYPEEL